MQHRPAAGGAAHAGEASELRTTTEDQPEDADVSQREVELHSAHHLFIASGNESLRKRLKIKLIWP